MQLERVFALSFASIHPLYVKKVQSKGRTRAELDEVLCWLTGYDKRQLAKQIQRGVDLRTFFQEAPRLHPRAKLITGTICGVRIEEIEHPLMKKIRWMDKLVDELAKGRPMEKVLRGQAAGSPARPGQRPGAAQPTAPGATAAPGARRASPATRRAAPRDRPPARPRSTPRRGR